MQQSVSGRGAIASYAELNAWQVAHIKSALEEDESDAPGVAHHDVVDWMDSWTDHERLMPVPKKLKRHMEIIWRAAALNDLEEIRRLIAQDNPPAASRVRALIRATVERLADHPY